MLRVTPLRATLALFLLAGAAACSGGGDDYVPPPAPTPSRAEARPAAEEEESVESRVAAMMETNERAMPNAETRDPFMQPRPELGGEGPLGLNSQPGPDCDIEEALGKTELSDLELIGLITGTALPRAMFLVPSTQQAVIVTEGALAGPDCTNRLIDVRDNEVVFEQVTMNEAERSTTTLQLNESRIASRFIQIESE